MRTSTLSAGDSLSSVAMAAYTVVLMARGFFYDRYGLTAMSICQFSAATTYILGCNPEYIAEDKNWCMKVLRTPMTATQGPEALSLRKPVLGDCNTGVTQEIYTATDAASMFGQSAHVTDKSGIWGSGEISKVEGVVMYSTTTQWHGNGASKTMLKVPVPARTVRPGENIELGSETELTHALPTLPGAAEGKCGEEFMSSQTTANSADEAKETRGVELTGIKMSTE